MQWMTLEFDPQCGTAQPEDSLQVYIPSLSMKDNGVLCPGGGGEAGQEQRAIQVNQGQDAAPPPYWAVLSKFSGTQNWPHQTVVLPGKEI